MLLKEYTVQKPEKSTKIQKRGAARYVYHVIKTTYDTKRKFNTDKRACIGKMVEGSDTLMTPNDQFSRYYPDVPMQLPSAPNPPEFSDTLHAGACIAIRKIAEDEGISEILEHVHGKERAADFLNLVTYIILRQSATLQHYAPFMRSHLQKGRHVRSDSHLSVLLRDALADDRIQETLRLWNQLHVGLSSIYVGYDSTNFNTGARGITLAEFGKAKDDPSLPQVNLAMAVSQADSTPLFYELYAGSIVDLSECDRMVEQMKDYGYQSVGFLFDRGYFTSDNVRALDRKGYPFLMMLKGNAMVRQMVHEHGPVLRDQTTCFLKGQDVCGITIHKKLFDDDKRERYFHIYYDDVRAGQERHRFLQWVAERESELSAWTGHRLRKNARLDMYNGFFHLEIEERETKRRGKVIRERWLTSWERCEDKIRAQKESYGFFVILSTQEMSAAQALDTYRNRDNIEKLFRSIKSGMDFDTPGVHSDESLKAKMHIIFLASIVWNRLYQITKSIKEKTKNKKDFTVPAVIALLENIECTLDSQGYYRRRYALTAKQKLVLNEIHITEEYIDHDIRRFAHE